MILGQDRAVEQFMGAWRSGAMHHAWLLAGPKGVGKASFARAAAIRVLAEAAGPPVTTPGLDTPADHPIARLIEAGSHPDMRWLERVENPNTGKLNRNITVDQIRDVGEFVTLTSSLSRWKAVVIDPADDLQKEGANALLKMLEEPPANSLFLLVAHAPGRLLPTIRSRCRRLDFQRLGDDVMASILERQAPDLAAGERARIVAMAAGSAGRAIAFASLGLARLEDSALAILRQGDPTNGKRAELAGELGKKGAADRYAAFLEMVPPLLAREARNLAGGQRERALDAYAKAREVVAAAPRLSLDPAATVFQLGSILASVPAPRIP